MNVQPETYAVRCLLTLACAGMLWQPPAAIAASDESLAGVAVKPAAAPTRPASGSLIGVTLEPGDLSLAAVTVVIRSVSGATARQLISDTDGNFCARDLPPGIYEIAVSKEGFTAPGATVEVAANRTTNANVQLTREIAGSLRGVAVAADGFSIGGVSIALRSVDRSIDRNLETDSDGMFMARDLPPGAYEVVASKPGFSDASPIIVEVVKNRTANASVMLADAKVIPLAQTAPTQTVPLASAQAPYRPPQNANHNAASPHAASAAVDTQTPFAFGDFTWLNGTPRTKDLVGDTPFFTPEVRFDTHFVTDFNQPTDHTIVGSSELFRAGEVQVEQASVGGDFHWKNVRGRILFMQGLFATTTPRNDASPGIGQWDLRDAYRYVSEAWGGYHFNVSHGLNVDAGIFVSYVGLFSYYNFDNWTYQPSYVSSNTPWYFNGVRVQWFLTNKLKIEPWVTNGWQSYGKFNTNPGLGGQILYMPREWLKLVLNQYGFGEDNVGLPHTQRIHTDNSIEVRWFNRPESNGISKIAFSLTGDAGCQYGGGISCTGHGGPKSSFLGCMTYHRMWFHKDVFAVTLGGGQMNNPGRYLTLLPPINGANAFTGTPYFTENPGDKAHMWDSTLNFQYMPNQYITWWAEVGYRHADIPYFAGRHGVTPPGGNNLYPQYYTCQSGVTAGTAGLNAATVVCGPSGGVWFPDLRRSEAKIYTGVMVKF